MVGGWSTARNAPTSGGARPVDARRSLLLAGCGALCAAIAILLGRDASAGVHSPLTAEAPAARTTDEAMAMVADADAAPTREAVDVGDTHDVEVEQPIAPREPLPPAAELDALTGALANDGIRWNASEAIARFHRLGAPAFPWLERALASADLQQRHLAAYTLRTSGAPPSDPLCRTSVDELRRLEIPGYYATVTQSPLVLATRWLVEHPTAARPALRAVRYAGDDQQRFLAAFLLARGGERDDVPGLCRELIAHLGDNQIEGDALMASHGLWCLGRQALGEVRLARRYADDQALRLLDRIERDVLAPPRDADELRARPDLRSITQVYDDPVRHFDIQRSVVPRW